MNDLPYAPSSRVALAARLKRRTAEIEAAILAYIDTLSESTAAIDAAYMAGLRTAVKDIVDYGLMSIELGEDWVEPIPSSALVQARRAARSAVGIETVLRRYAGGERLLAEFIVEELGDLSAQALRQVMKTQRVQLDRVMAAVAAAYTREHDQQGGINRRIEWRVQQLLAADEPASVEDLGYDFDVWHLGLVVTGPGSALIVRKLATELDHQLLLVPRGDSAVWAWLGGRLPPAVSEVERALPELQPEVSVAIGEPRRQLDGWRLTHLEAQAAFEVTQHLPRTLTRVRDVVLLAAVLRDEDLARSLRETYIAPLDQHGGSSAVLRETLRAYFASGCNAVTTAAALDVNRHTVQRRLRKVEDAIGRYLHTCHAELEVALKLEDVASCDKLVQ